MSSQERWSVFFRFLRDIRKRGKINEILSQEEGIAMAGVVIQTISRDQEERLRLITEHKNIMDWQSGMVEARREGIAEGRIEGIAEGRIEGIAEGRIEGIAEGRIEGIAEGRIEGIAEGRIETAKSLLSGGMEPERIAKYTGLSLDTVLKLWQDK